MMGFLAAGAVVLGVYNCEIQPPRSMKVEQDNASLHVIGFPAEMQKWKFSVSIADGNPLQATVTWPGNPMQAEGTFPALTTSEASYAFTAYTTGPCMFTETGCLTQFNIVDNKDGTANVIVTPSAIATFVEGKERKRGPLLVLITGTCSRAPK